MILNGTDAMKKLTAILLLSALFISGLSGCKTPSIQAKFSAKPTDGYAPVRVQFRDLSSGNISYWEWDLNGDGLADDTNQNPEYTYEVPGNYTVILRVRSIDGNDSEVKKDYIRVLPCPGVPNFTAEPTEGDCTTQDGRITCTGITTIRFIDQSEGNITSWAWDLNSDGILDHSEQNPTYTYRGNGVYSITLRIVTADCSPRLTKWDYITITGCPT